MSSLSTCINIDPDRILSLFYPYVAINSESKTDGERVAAEYVILTLGENTYFKTNPQLLALEPIPGDPYNRSLAWALIKGKSSRTVVLIHHIDVVEVEDFKRFRHLAFDPEALERALHAEPSSLDPDAQEDLASGDWIFGRGSADMKAGGAIQMALMAACSEVEDLAGNLLLLAVPDEEHLSAGMRAASALLHRLGELHDLEYVLMINSEPHQRRVPERGLLSGGSIGKQLAFVYVRGILAHAGKSYEGFNPLPLLGKIISRTEMSPDLVDIDESTGELSPPPTWLIARDGKAGYDVSMPLSAFGCLSILSLHSPPGKILGYLVNLSRECALRYAKTINESIDRFRSAAGRAGKGQPWTPVIQSFAEFLEEVHQTDPGRFEHFYRELRSDLESRLQKGTIDYFNATRNLMDAVFEFTCIDQPRIIIGLVPPFYPSVSYRQRPDFESFISELSRRLTCSSKSRFGQEYELEAYFTGISDLSYSSLGSFQASDMEAAMVRYMPLYGLRYSIPFEEIAQCSMPCVNIGPWGKDFHKLSERVLKEDLLVRTPLLVLQAIECAFDLTLAPRA